MRRKWPDDKRAGPGLAGGRGRAAGGARAARGRGGLFFAEEKAAPARGAFSRLSVCVLPKNSKMGGAGGGKREARREVLGRAGRAFGAS